MRSLAGFIFPERLNRLRYIWRILVTDLAAGFLALGVLADYPSPTEKLLKMLGLVALCVYQFVFVLLPRVRDTGMSGWCVVLSVVPFVYVFLTIFLVFRGPEYGSSRAVHQSAAKT